MGTCISKCMPNPSPTKQPSPLQDKLVISQSPRVATCVRVSHGHQYSSSTSSSSSASSSTTSISSSICASSCSSSLTSSSKHGYPRSETPWASARPPPHIVVLDPGSCKQSPVRTNPVNFIDQAPGTFPKKIADAQRKCQQPKRARSTSPALVRQKSFRSSPEHSSAVPARCQRQTSPCRPVQARQPTETGLRTPSPSLVGPGRSVREFQPNKAILGNRSLASPSPGRRFDGGAAGSVRPKCMPVEFPSHGRVTGESKTRAGPLATRKERLRNASSPSAPGLLHAPRWRRRETSVHPIVAPLEQEVAEIISDRDCGFAHIEDMNNPLIALDCFIFL